MTEPEKTENSVTSVIVDVKGKRGRAPGFISFEDGNEVSTFDGDQIRVASMARGKVATATYMLKPNLKDAGKPHKNLVTLTVDASVEPQVAPESTNGTLAIPDQRVSVVHTSQGHVGVPAVIDPLAELEMGYKVTQRRFELIIQMLKERLKLGTHYVDGKMFGGDKPVLLQPGAHAIFQGVGFSCAPEILHGPKEAPKDPNTEYTVIVRAEVRDLQGRFMGAQLGSCSSHIWSNRAGRFVPRAVDPDKTHNSTLKMATKRATVAACRQTTPASEIFAEDIEEGGYGEQDNTAEAQPKRGFIR